MYYKCIVLYRDTFTKELKENVILLKNSMVKKTRHCYIQINVLSRCVIKRLHCDICRTFKPKLNINTCLPLLAQTKIHVSLFKLHAFLHIWYMHVCFPGTVLSIPGTIIYVCNVH